MGGGGIDTWWRSLLWITRAELLKKPYAPVPVDLVAEVVHQGLVVVGTYWPATYPATVGFALPDEVSDWIAALPHR